MSVLLGNVLADRLVRLGCYARASDGADTRDSSSANYITARQAVTDTSAVSPRDARGTRALICGFANFDRTWTAANAIIASYEIAGWSDPRVAASLASRGRSPMCEQVARPLLDRGTGGRSPGFLFSASVPSSHALRSASVVLRRPSPPLRKPQRDRARCAAGSSARITSPITATPRAPAARQAPAVAAVTPASASTGMPWAAAARKASVPSGGP